MNMNNSWTVFIQTKYTQLHNLKQCHNVSLQAEILHFWRLCRQMFCILLKHEKVKISPALTLHSETLLALQWEVFQGNNLGKFAGLTSFGFLKVLQIYTASCPMSESNYFIYFYFPLDFVCSWRERANPVHYFVMNRKGSYCFIFTLL